MAHVTRLDQEALTALQHGGTLHASFERSVHVTIGNTLYTIGAHIGAGVHHIVMSDDFRAGNHFSAGDAVSIAGDSLFIGHRTYTLTNAQIDVHSPFLTHYSLNLHHVDLSAELTDLLASADAPSIYDTNAEATLSLPLLTKIRAYLENPTEPECVIGLGPGLTPLADDIVLGFALGSVALNETPFTIDQINPQATTQISYQSLQDVLARYLTEPLSQFLEDFFVHRTLRSAPEILKRGATSGAGILAGFVESIHYWRNHHERTQNP